MVVRAITSSQLTQSPLHLSSDQRNILSAKTEAVAQHSSALVIASRIGYVVEIAVGIGRFIVDRWRNCIVLQGLQTNDELGCSGCRDQVPSHTLRA